MMVQMISGNELMTRDAVCARKDGLLGLCASVLVWCWLGAAKSEQTGIRPDAGQRRIEGGRRRKLRGCDNSGFG